MSMRRPSPFRDGLQVSAAQLRHLDAVDLTRLVNDLLYAQAQRSGADASAIRINTDTNARDRGCDAWSPRTSSPDAWLGSAATCWQLKAGSAGAPARLRGETRKPVPRSHLAWGGRFVLVANGAVSGIAGEGPRRAVLAGDPHVRLAPSSVIEVFTSDRLAAWCNLHPAIAASWAGHPDGIWTLGDWLVSDEHRIDWQPSEATSVQIGQIQSAFDFNSSDILHLHLHGPPGVGKTRLALEACRAAHWSSAVVYIRQADDVRLLELIDGAAHEKNIRLVVVADEAAPETLLPLRDSVARSEGRVRLLTIGHDPTPDPRRVPALELKPLADDKVAQIVASWYPAMPREHIDFIVSLADGYVRLARLAADEVARNPTARAPDLLNLDHIRSYLDKLLGHRARRRSLHVVAALTSVGWNGEQAVEGIALAEHFGVPWDELRSEIETFQHRYGVVARGGRFVYVTPRPLAMLLASEAWAVFPEKMRSLPAALPTGAAVDSYCERLAMVVSVAGAHDLARSELVQFTKLGAYIDSEGAKRWSVLSRGDPAMAAANLRSVLASSSVEERRGLAHSARRELVDALVRLSWSRQTFVDSALSLAYLAEAENESWANNASGEFVRRFQLRLGGTAVPYRDRLAVIDQLFELRSPVLDALAVRALAQVGSTSESRSGGTPDSDTPIAPEWRPTSGAEAIECARQSLRRITTLASRPEAAPVHEALIEAARSIVNLAPVQDLQSEVQEALSLIASRGQRAREAVLEALHHFARGSRLRGEESAVTETERLLGVLEDSSLHGRLVRALAHVDWDTASRPDLAPLALELLARGALRNEWHWLTSGRAQDGWRLGQALADSDDGSLEDLLPALPGGRDLRVVAGYVARRRAILGDEWYEDWFARHSEGTNSPSLLFEITWRCGATDRTVLLLARSVRSLGSGDMAGYLAFGVWHQTLSKGPLEELLRALLEAGNAGIVTEILEHRLDSRPDEGDYWEELASLVVCDPTVIRSTQMTAYAWAKLATRLIAARAAAIAAAILDQQGRDTASNWFIEHSDANDVLLACTRKDPHGVWDALRRRLMGDDAEFFLIGFPRGLVDLMPRESVLGWVDGAPDRRCAAMSKLVAKDLASDDTLAAELLGKYGSRARVRSAFLAAFLTGTWWGPASNRSNGLAEALAQVASRTALPKLATWASWASEQFGEMARQEREREDEEKVRPR